MKFRTEVTKGNLPFGVSYNDSLMFVGSCFAQNIGKQFQQLKFKTLINPRGIVYNPVSLFGFLDQLFLPAKIDVGEFIELNEIFYSWNHHSDYSGLTAEGLKLKIEGFS